MIKSENSKNSHIKRQLPKRKPAYRIEAITLITSSGKRIPLTVFCKEVITQPLSIVKRKLLDAFSTMSDIPIDIEFKVRSLFNI